MDNHLRPSPSPERGLQHIFRSRSKKGGEGANSSTTSLHSDVPSNSERGGLRASVDRSIDKLKDKIRDGNDVERTSSIDSGRKMSKLVPKRPKRKKKGDDGGSKFNDLYGSKGDISLGVPPSENNNKLNLPSRNASTESLSKSGGSSLLTEDSDPEAPDARPHLESRSSHAEYLTFTSPLITAATVDNAESKDQPKQDASLLLAPPTEPDPAAGDSARSPQTTSPTKSPSSIDKVRDVLSSSNKPGAQAVNNLITKKSNSIPRKEVASHRPHTAGSNKSLVSPISTSSSTDDRPGTPSTFITPPTPTVRGESPPKRNPKRSTISLGPAPADEVSTAGHGPSPTPKDPYCHRRARSSTATSILTPQPEEVKTPGGTLISPSGSSGFFSSVFSATQSAVNQISSLANNTVPGQRSRSGTGASKSERRSSTEGEGVYLNDQENTVEPRDVKAEPQEPALATLGAGNLSLTHLGITEGSRDTAGMTTRTETVGASTRSRSSTARSDEASAAEAVSAAYSKPTSEKSVPIGNDNRTGRPGSIASTVDATSGDATPPRTLTNITSASTIGRSASLNSRIGGRKKRSRNSSGATGGAIAAALSASHSTLANPTAGLAERRPTGFAVASGKRNREFHQTFRSVPEDDYLVEDYSAALQRDILLQGRLYVSEKHICFSSNILGWVTNLVISFDEVLAMERKNTAMIFPNAIIIQTLHAKHVFASFMNRDPTYDMLISIWKVGHPNLKSSEAGHTLDENGTDEKVELADSPDSGADSGSDSADDAEDENGIQSDDLGDAASDIADKALSAAGSEAGDTVRVVSTKVSQPVIPSTAGVNGVAGKGPEVSPPSTAIMTDFPGPSTHGPTDCTDQESHFDKTALDTTIPAPLGRIYSMMFGPLSGSVMRKFLIDDQKSTDLQLEDDKKGLGEDIKSSTYSYIKPLSGSIGPKQTKCIVSSVLDIFDLEKVVTVTCSTQTPDVPSGNVFATKTKYCLTWGPGNSTRIVMTATVEWSGKSWIKGPIEKGAADGQVQHGKDLTAFLKSQLAARSPAKLPRGTAATTKVKTKKRSRGTAGTVSPSAGVASAASSATRSKSSGWGVLEPLHGVLGPAGDLVAPLMTTTGVLALLLVFVSSMWARSSWRVGGVAGSGGVRGGLAYPGFMGPEHRVAAYEQLWATEEEHLWDWFEDRLSLDGVLVSDGAAAQKPLPRRRRAASEDGRDGMSERQVDDAIRVTEERLHSLKEMVERRRRRIRVDGEDRDGV